MPRVLLSRPPASPHAWRHWFMKRAVFMTYPEYRFRALTADGEMKQELTADYPDAPLLIRALGVIRGSKSHPMCGIRGIILGIAVGAGVCVFGIRMDSRIAFLIMAAMTGQFPRGPVTIRSAV